MISGHPDKFLPLTILAVFTFRTTNPLAPRIGCHLALLPLPESPEPSALAPAAQALGPSRTGSAPPRRGPDRALPPCPGFPAAELPRRPRQAPARQRAPVGGPTVHPLPETGDMPITDSRPRFHPLAQNPDLCWRYSQYGPASLQIDGVHRLAVNCKSFPDRTQANNPLVEPGSISSRQDH